MESVVTFVIGAALGGSFASTIGTVESKVKTIDSSIGSLGKTMKQIDTLRGLDESLIKNKGGLEKARSDLAALEPRLAEIRNKYTSLETAVKAADTEMSASKMNYEQVKNRVSALKIELQNTDAPTNEMRNALAAANRELAQSKLRFDESKTAMSKAKSELSAVTPELKELDQAHKKASSNVDMFENTIKKETHSVNELGEAFKKAKIDTANLDAEQKKLGSTLEKQKARKEKIGALVEQRDALTSQRAKLQSQAVGLIGAGMTLSLPIKLALEKEDWMLDVSKNVKGLDSAEDIKAVELEIRKIGRSSLLGSAGIAKLVASAGTIGMAKEEALEYAKSAERIGVAFGISADEAGGALASIMSTTGFSLGEMNDMADAINYFGDASNAKAHQITPVLQRNAGTLKSMTNLTKSQMVGFTASIRQVAQNDEAAATAQKNFILSLTKGEAATKAQSEAFEALGLSSEEVAEGMQNDAAGTITRVLEALNGVDAVQRTTLSAEIFGGGNVDVVSNLLSNLEEYKRLMGLAGDETKFAGSVNAEYERKMETTATALSTLKESVKDVGITLGEALLPPLAVVSKVLAGTANIIGNTIQRFPLASKAVLTLGAGLTVGVGAVVAFGYVLNVMRTGLVYTRLALIGTKTEASWASRAISGLGRAFNLTTIRAKAAAVGTWIYNTALRMKTVSARIATTSLSRLGAMMSLTRVKAIGVTVATRAWTAAQWLFNTAMAANPIGLAIAAGAALIGIGVLLYKKWEPFRKIIDGIGSAFKKFGGAIGKVFGFGKKDEQVSKPGSVVKNTIGTTVAPNRQIIPDRKAGSTREIPSLSPYVKSGGGKQNITNVTIKSSPTIVVQGGSVDGAKAALAGHHDDLARKIKKMQEEKSRVSYD